MSDSFDARAAVRELALLAPAHRGRKLTFARKCGAYAALYNGVANALVAEEFHLSRASVSALAGCRDDPRTATVINIGEYSETFPSPSLTARRHPERKPRYQDVAAEFDRLGADRFLTAYFTPQLHHALIGRVRAIAGADPNANQFAGLFQQNAGIPSMPDLIDRYWIDWHDGSWQYHACEKNGELIPTSKWSGEFPQPLRFKTSEEAHTYLLNRP